MAEDITTNTPSLIGTHGDWIRTLLFDATSRTLFVGDDTGHVLQYKRDRESGAFTLLKDFGDLGIGRVVSSTVVRDFAIFGGWKTNKIRAIKIKESQVLEGTLETAFNNVYSLQTCRVSDSNTLISVGGYKPSYSSTSSDVYRVKTQTQPPTPKPESTKITHSPTPSPEHSSRDILDALAWGIHKYIHTLFRVYADKHSVNLDKCREPEYLIKSSSQEGDRLRVRPRPEAGRHHPQLRAREPR